MSLKSTIGGGSRLGVGEEIRSGNFSSYQPWEPMMAIGADRSIVSHDTALDIYDPTDVIPPFQRTVPPGRYRVVAGTVDTSFEGTRVAYLALWIKDTPVVREEYAYLEGRDAFGYGVDAGIGCFVAATLAATARTTVRAAIDAYDPVVLYGDWNYLDYQVGEGNVVMCPSGFGDGYYPTYVGLDAQDEVVCFVTDFGVIDNDVEDDENQEDEE